MARQKGYVKLKGQIGDLTFFKTKDGYMAREKTGVDGGRIKNDPAFQRTRENGQEFGHAGKAGKLVRQAFRPLLLNSPDGRMFIRLSKEMVRITKSDTTHRRGERTVIGGDLASLVGFEFNALAPLSMVFFGKYSLILDRVNGTHQISFSDFKTNEQIAHPSGATHVRITAGIAELSFLDEKHEFMEASSVMLPINNEVVSELNLALTSTPGTDWDLMVVLGFDVLQEVNGEYYSLKSEVYNALQIISVDRV